MLCHLFDEQMDVWHFVLSHSKLNLNKSMVAISFGSFYSYGS